MSATGRDNSHLPPKFQEPSKTKWAALNLALNPISAQPDFRKRKDNSFRGPFTPCLNVLLTAHAPLQGVTISMFFCVPVGLEYSPVSFSMDDPRETETIKERRTRKYMLLRVWIKYYYSANRNIRGITEKVRPGESPAHLSSPHVGHSVA